MSKSRKKRNYDAVIVGGGFYGCMIALFLAERRNRVLLVEKEEDLLTGASYNNQGRVHNGYHYPRSFITALRSHVNHAHFISDFKEAVDDEFTMVYAIASNFSKVTPRQFTKFCQKVGSPLKPAPEKTKNLFDKRLVEEVFVVEEHIFNAGILRDILKKRLKKRGVSILLGKEVVRVAKNSEGFIEIHFKTGEVFVSRQVFNCAYSRINHLLKNWPFYEIRSQGYIRSGERGFGYFRDFELMAETVLENNLDEESVIAFRYDSSTKTIEDITEETRDRLVKLF